MSEEQRPNVNAVGIVTDIFESMRKYMRGNAAENPDVALDVTRPIIEQFANEISDTLDKEFGKEITICDNCENPLMKVKYEGPTTLWNSRKRREKDYYWVHALTNQVQCLPVRKAAPRIIKNYF